MKRCLLFLLIALVGCASYIALPLDTMVRKPRMAHNKIKKQEKKGLIIAAEDYSEYRKCRRYFYRDLLSMGYIPIYLCMGNHSDFEFTVRRENIIFRLEDGTEAKAVDAKEVIDDAQSSPGKSLFAFPLGIIPVFLIWGSISSANDQLDQDYSQKAFRDTHLIKGDDLVGFLFFKVPEGKKIQSVKDATLEVNATKKAGQGELAETLQFIVSIETN